MGDEQRIQRNESSAVLARKAKRLKLVERIGYGCTISAGLIVIFQSGLSLLSTALAAAGVWMTLEAQSRLKKSKDDAL